MSLPNGASCAVSVIIPARNAALYLPEALASVAAQTCPPQEVIVIDDGSIDDTGAIAARHPNVRVLRRACSGVSVTRNAGVEAAQFPLIAFLDADDRWHPTKLQRQCAVLNANPPAQMVITGYREIDAQGRDLGQGGAPQNVSLVELMTRNVVHTSTALMRRDAFLEQGGFDPNLDACEDYDLWLRIAAQSEHAIQSLPVPLADYRRHAGQTTRDWAKMHLGWTQVAHRLAQDHPRIWPNVARTAEAYHLEYCASLAFNAGDNAATRRLMRRAWQRGGLACLAAPNMRHMTRVALNTCLPARLQSVLRRIKSGL